MSAIDPRTLLAGAAGPHGRHERPDEGWDPDQRTRHGDTPDALAYGRHALPGKGER
jgi:hypothetical protein